MYIRNPEKVNWIQQRLNINDNHPQFSVEQKKHILKKLNEAVSFENFLHTKYVGQKRFSLEGGESLIQRFRCSGRSCSKSRCRRVCDGNGSQRTIKYLDQYFWKINKRYFQ